MTRMARIFLSVKSVSFVVNRFFGASTTTLRRQAKPVRPATEKLRRTKRFSGQSVGQQAPRRTRWTARVVRARRGLARQKPAEVSEGLQGLLRRKRTETGPTGSELFCS